MWVPLWSLRNVTMKSAMTTGFRLLSMSEAKKTPTLLCQNIILSTSCSLSHAQMDRRWFTGSAANCGFVIPQCEHKHAASYSGWKYSWKNIWLFEHRVYNLQHGWYSINDFDFSTGFVSVCQNKAKSSSFHVSSMFFNPDSIKTRWSDYDDVSKQKQEIFFYLFLFPQKSFPKQKWKNIIFSLSNTFHLTNSFLAVVDKQWHFLLRRRSEVGYKWEEAQNLSDKRMVEDWQAKEGLENTRKVECDLPVYKGNSYKLCTCSSL